MAWKEQYNIQLLKSLNPFLTIPVTSYTCTPHDLKRLQHQVQVCDNIADALKQASAQVKNLININASPIFRLPNEILSEIMLWACDIPELTNFKPLKHQRFGKCMSPVVLGQVCHRWRKVSTGDPRLWTFLWIDLTFETSMRDLQRVDHWFRMARELPLTINITHNDDTRLVDEVHSEKLLPDWKPCQQVLNTLFKDYAHQIGSLFFGILDGGWGDMLRTPMNFAKLSHLTINGELDPVFVPSSVYMFANAPQLKSVDLWAVNPTSLRLPWNRISSFRGCWMALDGVVTILRLCPNLGSLRVRNMEGAEDGSMQIPRLDPLLLPRLHTFEVTDVPQNEIVFNLLQSLYCPSLLKFKYNTFGSRAHSSTIIPFLLPFLRRSNPLSLDVSGVLFRRDDLEIFLRSVPSLHHLVLDLSKRPGEAGADDSAMSFVRLFHRHDVGDQHGVLPKLCHLELEADPKLSFEALFVAFGTRCPRQVLAFYHAIKLSGASSSVNGIGCGLVSARININASTDHVAHAEWKTWLDSLHQRGLHVRLNILFAKTPIAFTPALVVASAPAPAITSAEPRVSSFI